MDHSPGGGGPFWDKKVYGEKNTIMRDFIMIKSCT